MLNDKIKDSLYATQTEVLNVLNSKSKITVEDINKFREKHIEANSTDEFYSYNWIKVIPSENDDISNNGLLLEIEDFATQKLFMLQTEESEWSCETFMWIMSTLANDGKLPFKLNIPFKQFMYLKKALYSRKKVPKLDKRLTSIIKRFNTGYKGKKPYSFNNKDITGNVTKDVHTLKNELTGLYVNTVNNIQWFKKVDVLLCELECIRTEEMVKREM